MKLFSSIRKTPKSDKIMKKSKEKKLINIYPNNLNFTEAENNAFKDQIDNLPKMIKDELGDWRGEYTAQKTKESNFC